MYQEVQLGYSCFPWPLHVHREHNSVEALMMISLFDKIIHEKKKIPLFAGKDERLIFPNVLNYFLYNSFHKYYKVHIIL